VDRLVKSSERRVQDSEVFKKIGEYAKMLKDRRSDSVLPLSLQEYRDEMDRLDAENEKFDKLYPKIKALTINNLTADIDYIQSDSTRIAKNKDIVKGIRKDAQLEEAVAIMHDMIVLNVN
jgi:uncharacterized protein YdcH (DUF465 family)